MIARCVHKAQGRKGHQDAAAKGWNKRYWYQKSSGVCRYPELVHSINIPNTMLNRKILFKVQELVTVISHAFRENPLPH